MSICHRISMIAVLAVSALAGTATAITLDGYAATVGDSVITIGEVKEEMQRSNRDLFMAMRAGEEVSEDRLAAAYREALDNLVAEELVLAEYRKLKEDDKIDIPEDAVDTTVQGIIRDRYGNDRAAFFNDLKRSGTSFDEFKDQQRRNIVMMVMRNRQFPNLVAVSPGMVKKLYEERADQYTTPAQAEIALIVVDGDEGGEGARARAEQLLDRIGSGEEFAAVAEDGSDGSRASEGGYRGWMDIESLREELREAIGEMNVGETSDVIEAGNSFYILDLKDLRPARTKPLAEVEEDLRLELRREAMKEQMDAWVADLERKHYVKRYPLPTDL